MKLSEKGRKRMQFWVAILMFFGVLNNFYQFFISEEPQGTQLFTAVCFCICGVIFFLQSRGIIKSG